MPPDRPDVNVVEIPPIANETPIGRGVDLGGQHNPVAGSREDMVNQILSQFRSQSDRVFELTWEGNKVPRGAIILGREIAWTQHGRVVAEGGEMIGTYQRLIEFGGPDGVTQKMRVYVKADRSGHEEN